MSRFSPFRLLLKRRAANSPSLRLRSFRPGLEALEDHILPSSVPTFSHVVVVMEENHSYADVIGQSSAPYINSLASGPNAALFTQSYAIEHPSQPNYLDFFSGSNQGVTNDSTPAGLPFNTPNLGAELLQSGKSFVTYSEDLPSVGYASSSSGGYARKHNPAVNWQGTYGTSAYSIPAADNLPFSSFPTSNFSSLPTVSFVIPNLNDDMHDGTVQQGDTWLKNNLSAYATWAQTHNSLLIVTWDEDDFSQSNQIPTIFVGQGVNAGQYSEPISHFSVLRTIEDMYGLPYAGKSGTASPITDVWANSTNQAPVITTPASASPSTVTGTTTNLSVQASDPNGDPLTYTWAVTSGPSGVTFSKNGSGASNATTATFTQSGTYTFQVTARDPGGLVATSSVQVTATVPVTVTPGIYQIVNQGSGTSLEIPGFSKAKGAQADISHSTGTTNQQWNIQAVGGGYYTITNVASGMLLDDAGASPNRGSHIIQWPSNGGTNQEWSFRRASNGTLEIVNRASGLVLDVSGGATADGSPVIQWSDNGGTANQEWTLRPVA